MADMQRFGHRAEVGFQAARHRSRHRQGDGCLIGVQADQPGTPRRRAEDAERRRRVPTLVVVMGVDRAGEAHFGLEPHRVGGQQVLPRQRAFLGQGEQRGDQGHRLMAAEHG